MKWKKTSTGKCWGTKASPDSLWVWGGW